MACWDLRLKMNVWLCSNYNESLYYIFFINCKALLDDDLLQSFIKKRMQEMVDNQSSVSSKRFGNMVDLATGEDFLIAVDKEDKGVSVIIFIYENDVAGCNTSYQCLKLIAKEYPHVKFCRIRASVVPLSKQFKDSGVPAIQGWRGGELLASLVRITDNLGEDFFMSDLEGYLIENGLLTDKNLVPTVIRGPANHAGENDEDSEWKLCWLKLKINGQKRDFLTNLKQGQSSYSLLIKIILIISVNEYFIEIAISVLFLNFWHYLSIFSGVLVSSGHM